MRTTAVWLALCSWSCVEAPTRIEDPVDSRAPIVGAELAYVADDLRLQASPDGVRATHLGIAVHHDGAAIHLGQGNSELVLAASTVTLDGAHASPGAGRLVDGVLVTPLGADIEEHFALAASGVELTWQVARGETIAVQIPIGGLAFVGQTAQGLVFRGPDESGFIISDATWITGADETIVSTRFENDELVLEVPEVTGTQQAASKLKITIGVERAADGAIAGSPTGFESRASSVAFSGAQFLAVWQDVRNGNADIYGTRITTTGAITDTTGLKIATGTNAQLTPTVAFVNGSYLVVWEDRSTGDLAAARVSPATGAVTQLGTVAATVANEQRPMLAARGTEALLVYQTTAGDIGAVRFAGGTFKTPFVVANTAGVEAEPAVVANPAGDYLVAFTEGTTSLRELRGQLVGPLGTLVGTQFDISAASGAQYAASLAFTGGHYVAVWASNFSGLYVAGTRISSSGTVLDTRTEIAAGITRIVGGTLLTALPNRAASQPAVACTATACWVTWRDGRTFGTSQYDVYGRLFNATLAPISAEAVVSGGLDYQSLPHVTPAGTSFFTSWSDRRDGNGFSVCGSRITAAGVVSDPAGILIARGFNREVFAAAARSGSTWLLAWSDSRVRGPNILGTRVSNNGNPTDSPPINVSNAPATQAAPNIAVSGLAGTTDYMVVWSDNRNGTKDVFAARVPQAGATLDPNGIAIATTTGDQTRPDIASDPTGRYLVVWQDRHQGTSNYDIYGAILDTTGAIVAPSFLIATAGRDQTTPALAYDTVNKVYLVVWADLRNGASDLYAARVTSAGLVLDPNGVAIVTSSVNKIDPAIAFGDGRFMLAWRDGTDLYGTRLTTSGGIATDASKFAIATAAGMQATPTVAYLGDADKTFAIAWSDSRTLDTSREDIYGALVDEDTRTVVSEHVISASAESELRPVFSRGKAKKQGTIVEVLVGYQHVSSTASTERMVMRKLSYQP